MQRSLSPLSREQKGHTSSSALRQQYREHALRVRGVTEKTASQERLYLKRLLEYFGAVEKPAMLFAGLTPAGVSAFLGDYSSSHGSGSRGWMQKTLRSFLRFAYQHSYLERDLSALVPSVRSCRMGRVPQALPDSCISALGTEIRQDTPAGLRDAAIVCLLATYGVRGVQIRRLQLEHVCWQGERIFFPAAKGGKGIDQHLTPEAGNALMDYLLHGRRDNSIREVFQTLTDPPRPLHYASTLSGILRRHMDRLGLETPAGVSRGSHGFRHAFAVRMTGRVPFKDVMDLLGHRDPSSTLIYGKSNIEDLRRAALPWPGGAS